MSARIRRLLIWLGALGRASELTLFMASTVPGMICMMPRLLMRPAERQFPSDTTMSTLRLEMREKTANGMHINNRGMTKKEAEATRAIQSCTCKKRVAHANESNSRFTSILSQNPYE
jgi:hypothetical protein